MAGEKTRFRTGEEAAEKGRLGGIASGESRRKRKELREILYDMLAGKMPEGDQTVAEAVCGGLIKRAIEGDPKAFSMIENLTKSVHSEKKFEAVFGNFL